MLGVRCLCFLGMRALGPPPKLTDAGAGQDLPAGLKILDVPVQEATAESLAGFGFVVNSADEFTVKNKNFEIKKW